MVDISKLKISYERYYLELFIDCLALPSRDIMYLVASVRPSELS